MTNNNLTFDQFKANASLSQPLNKKVPLNSLRLLGDSAIIYNGHTFGLSDNALKSLYRVLKISASLIKTLEELKGKKETQAFVKNLQDAMSKAKGIEVTLVLNQKDNMITHIQTSNNPILGLSQFFGIVENVMDTNGLEIKGMSVDELGGVKITTLNKNWGYELPYLKDEVFTTGLTFTNGIGIGTRITPFFNRLVCTNGMIASFDMPGAISLKGYDEESVKSFLERIYGLNGPDQSTNFAFGERLKKMIHTDASFAELLAIKSAVVGSSEVRKSAHQKIEQFFPVNGFVDDYKRATNRDLFDFNKDYLRNVNTGISTWDLLNNLTDIASHDYGLGMSASDSMKLQKLAGDFLSKKKFDTEFLMPQINFKSKK